MSGYLQKIKTKIPHSLREVDIDVKGRTLILTGGNGCGKTLLLNYIHQELTKKVIKKDNSTLENLISNKKIFEDNLKGMSALDLNYNFYKMELTKINKNIKETQNPTIVLDRLEKFIINYEKLKSVILKFEAMRVSKIRQPDAIKSIKSLRGQDTIHTNAEVSSLFEEFLVTNIANQAFSESTTINNNFKEGERIAKWFEKLELDLQGLFEDCSLKLKFQSDSLSFAIFQKNKDPYTLQQLSSGFSSIMSIYADLITRVSLRSVSPDELDGIVLIDEIDAHLHVSLQKKILTFLKNSFPKIQFIVTTHSPFVLSSIKDAVIYDLSKLEQVEDLSMYSYEAILEGLFNVLPISSHLQEKIELLSKLINDVPLNVLKIESILQEIPNDENLDVESAYFLKTAQIAVSKAKRNN